MVGHAVAVGTVAAVVVVDSAAVVVGFELFGEFADHVVDLELIFRMSF
jgi:hypothetical protein